MAPHGSRSPKLTDREYS